ncbi:endonuclease [Actinomadura sp. HBU206391]|uniref:endonuclease n=1 Tax=Actinomadura sp. HBU206391 TaxID=2731692 RepID=UPI00164FE594|nr:endonuclease [Actinomadura sp. HBU206391]MBC6462299.1 endonuclease [Actinomadura sp. HBU206391]
MDALMRHLLREGGTTYARESDITLKDQPAPLFQLLVLANLLSARMSADIGIAAARELFAAGGTTPRGMLRLSWQDRVDALGRGHYVRYDESTATRLGEMSELALEKYAGDLRRLARDSERDRGRALELLQEFPGIGPTGADIFCREAQAVWPWLRPYLDDQTVKGAERLGLPKDPKRLADLVPESDLARFAAALVRVARDKKLADAIRR